MAKNYDVDTRAVFADGKLHVEQSQDVEPTLNSIRAIKDSGVVGKDTKHVARVPQVLFMKWGLEDAGDQRAYLQGRHNKDPELAAKLAARLNSNEFHQFRIWEGTVSKSDMLKEGNKLASLS